MKIALVGYGRMGQLIDTLAVAQSHDIVAIIDPSHARATHQRLSKQAVEDADVCIDFTHGEAVLENARQITEAGKSLVIGTTGWDKDRHAVEAFVAQAGTSAVYGANFSIGIQLFYSIVQHTAELLRGFSEYSATGIEFHHSQKRDCPSGTALKLSEIVQSELGPTAPPFAFSSVRGGYFPGTHALMFDSLCDTIELRHTARSRQGFAEGALMAAHWIQGRVGFHTVEEMILEIALQAQEIPKTV